MKNLKILVINGPNINLTGTREPVVYGTQTLDGINRSVTESAESLGISVDFYQTNHEGEIIDRIQDSVGLYDGIILNAGAYSHYSYAIRDAVAAVSVPVIEVHMSNIYAREDFRRVSVISAVCAATVSGFGSFGYHLALAGLAERLKEI